jgi:hypothetical protein
MNTQWFAKLLVEAAGEPRHGTHCRDDRQEWRYYQPERGWVRGIAYPDNRENMAEHVAIMNAQYEHLDPSIFSTSEHLGEGHKTLWFSRGVKRILEQPLPGLTQLERMMFEGDATTVNGRAAALHPVTDKTLQRLVDDGWHPAQAETLVAIRDEFSLTPADFKKIQGECMADPSRLFTYAVSAWAASEITYTAPRMEETGYVEDNTDDEPQNPDDALWADKDAREYDASETMAYHFLDDPRDAQLDTLTQKAIEHLFHIQTLPALAKTAQKIIEWQNQQPRPVVNFRQLWKWYQLRKELLYRRHGIKISKAAKRLTEPDVDLNAAAKWIAKLPEPARSDLMAEHRRARYRRARAEEQDRLNGNWDNPVVPITTTEA